MEIIIFTIAIGTLGMAAAALGGIFALYAASQD